MTSRPSHEQFAACLQQEFSIQLPDTEISSLQLIKVDAQKPSQPQSDALQSYTLLFRGPMQPVLSQQIVTLTHPQLGEQAIFLVPVGPDDEGICYEAIFN